MLVVRIEKGGRGIFRPIEDNGCDLRKVDEIKMVYERHGEGFPIPFNDGVDIYQDDKEWFCAYKSIEQMKAWVNPEELKYFIKIGFKVYLLSISEFQVGGFQIVFTNEGIITKTDITDSII